MKYEANIRTRFRARFTHKKSLKRKMIGLSQSIICFQVEIVCWALNNSHGKKVCKWRIIRFLLFLIRFLGAIVKNLELHWITRLAFSINVWIHYSKSMQNRFQHHNRQSVSIFCSFQYNCKETKGKRNNKKSICEYEKCIRFVQTSVSKCNQKCSNKKWNFAHLCAASVPLVEHWTSEKLSNSRYCLALYWFNIQDHIYFREFPVKGQHYANSLILILLCTIGRHSSFMPFVLVNFCNLPAAV